MIASLVKESRIAKGFTQKELAELSNISIRSIQRIENGDIMPRSYTLKTLAGILERPFEEFAAILRPEEESLPAIETDVAQPPKKERFNQPQRVILSVAIPVLLMLLAWAFIAQSKRFPETNFELIIFLAIVAGIITIALAWLWRKR